MGFLLTRNWWTCCCCCCSCSSGYRRARDWWLWNREWASRTGSWRVRRSRRASWIGRLRRAAWGSSRIATGNRFDWYPNSWPPGCRSRLGPGRSAVLRTDCGCRCRAASDWIARGSCGPRSRSWTPSPASPSTRPPTPATRTWFPSLIPLNPIYQLNSIITISFIIIHYLVMYLCFGIFNMLIQGTNQTRLMTTANVNLMIIRTEKSKKKGWKDLLV